MTMKNAATDLKQYRDNYPGIDPPNDSSLDLNKRFFSNEIPVQGRKLQPSLAVKIDDLLVRFR